MRETNFGTNFQVKDDNRLDVLRKDEKLPDYIEKSRQVRKLLQEAANEDSGWDQMPEEIGGIEDIFEKAKDLVTTKWNEKVSKYIEARCKVWIEQIKDNPKFAKEAELLSNPQILEEKLRIRQFGVLESIRKIIPDAWLELVLISSERQLAAVAVAKKWIKNIPEKRKHQITEICDVKSVEELEIFADIGAIMGKYIDHAYVKQVELAVAPGGSDTTPLGGTSEGIKYLYDLPSEEEGKEVDIKPYSEVFPFEWDRITKSLNNLANKVDTALATGKLGDEYKKLPNYLKQMSETYGSKIINPEELAKKWKELVKKMLDLSKEGCPIMLIPQTCAAVADNANKIDVELRLGFITREAKELSKSIEDFRGVAQELLSAQTPYLSKEQIVPPVITNYQPSAFGPNTYWTTRGERGSEKIVAHTNAVIDVAVATALPALQSAFNHPPDENRFKKATILDNTLHELGHTLAPNNDTLVRKRVGTSADSKIAEELKADTGNMKILKLTLEKGLAKSVNGSDQLWAKLGDVCDYLKNKSSASGTSGERYYFAGLAMISRLIDNGVLIEKDGKYSISDANAGIAALEKIHDELTEIYLKGNQDELHEYINKIRAKKDDPEILKFITLLQTK